MKQGRATLCSVVALNLILGPAARATTTDHLSSAGDSAYAIFDSFDSTGCVETFVTMNAAAYMQHNAPGAPLKPGPFLAVLIFQNDLCTGAFSSAFGEAVVPEEA